MRVRNKLQLRTSMWKRIITLLVVLVVLAGLAAGLVFGIGWYLSPQDALVPSNAIVAISGGETDSRTREAVALYRAGYATTIVFSGAAADKSGPSNAATMRAEAIKSGVPASDIIIEEQAENTNQNAADVAEIIQNQKWTRIILVTSPYHQRRASLLFERELGKSVTIINHSTTDEAWRRSRWWDSEYSLALTLSELQKTVFLLLTKPK
jgi:uncharacterized SAM-binding protein YcdF (DUF218 family)